MQDGRAPGSGHTANSGGTGGLCGPGFGQGLSQAAPHPVRAHTSHCVRSEFCNIAHPPRSVHSLTIIPRDLVGKTSQLPPLLTNTSCSRGEECRSVQYNHPAVDETRACAKEVLPELTGRGRHRPSYSSWASVQFYFSAIIPQAQTLSITWELREVK